MPKERVRCPVTNTFCSELTLLEIQKDRNPVTGVLTIEDEDGVHKIATEDDPYQEEQQLRSWADNHPAHCIKGLGIISCGAAAGMMGYFAE